MFRPLVFSILTLSFNVKILSMDEHNIQEGLGDWYLRDETRHTHTEENLEFIVLSTIEEKQCIDEIKIEEKERFHYKIKHPNKTVLERLQQTFENHFWEQKAKGWNIAWENGNTCFTLKTSKSSLEITKMLNKIKKEILTEKWTEHE